MKKIDSEKKPRNRHANKRRLESIRIWYEAAWDSLKISDEHSKELYDGNEFPPLGLALEPMEELKLLLRHQREGDANNVSAAEEMIVDWHEQNNIVSAPLSSGPRGDKMLVYKIAASLFNNQLERDQKGDTRFGIKPCRLDEKPITPGALQRAIHRFDQSREGS